MHITAIIYARRTEIELQTSLFVGVLMALSPHNGVILVASHPTSRVMETRVRLQSSS